MKITNRKHIIRCLVLLTKRRIKLRYQVSLSCKKMKYDLSLIYLQTNQKTNYIRSFLYYDAMFFSVYLIKYTNIAHLIHHMYVMLQCQLLQIYLVVQTNSTSSTFNAKKVNHILCFCYENTRNYQNNMCCVSLIKNKRSL